MKILFCELWRDDDAFSSVGIFEGCGVYRGFSVFNVSHFRFSLGVSADCDSWRYWSSYHFDRLLLWASGAWTSDLDCSSKQCSLVNLTVLWSISTRVRVDVMSFQILAIDTTTNRWICVAITISVEWRLAKVSAQSRIS